MKKILLLSILCQFLFAYNLENFIIQSNYSQEKKYEILQKSINFNRFDFDNEKNNSRAYGKNSENLTQYLNEQEIQESAMPEPKNHFEETGNFKPFFKKDFFVMFKFINLGYDKWDFEGFAAGYCVSDESCVGGK